MAIAQWGFFSVPYLLRDGSSLYNGHLLEPVTLAPVDGVLCSGAVTTCLNDLASVATGNRTPISRMQGECSEPYWWCLKNHMANYNLYPWLYITNKLVITVMHIHMPKYKYLHSSNELNMSLSIYTLMGTPHLKIWKKNVTLYTISMI